MNAIVFSEPGRISRAAAPCEYAGSQIHYGLASVFELLKE
jgi:hypothetical protein